ncbi:hypothetical protein NKDENANG_02941 [Candidatus Entotheonellaceae bacterium PAL068K]
MSMQVPKPFGLWAVFGLGMVFLCRAPEAAPTDWVELSNDERATVQAAIEAEVGRRSDYDEPPFVKQAKQDALSEEEHHSRRVQEQIKTLRRDLTRSKSARDAQQARVEGLRRHQDEASHKYQSAVDKIGRLAAQQKELEREIQKQKQHLKKQLENEPVGALVTAVLFKKGFRGPSLADLEREADRQASAVAIAEQLTYIESTTLISAGVLQHDSITRRIAGRAEADN